MVPPAVNLWCVSSAVGEALLETMAAKLSRDERDRAARLLVPRARREFIVGRAVLRIMLAEHLGLNLADVVLEQPESGRPHVAAHLARDVSFSVSHSGDRVMVAVADGCDVGVDVELMRDLPDGMDIARRVMSLAQVDLLLAVPSARRHEAFFRCWTRIEAILKGMGLGLAGPVAELVVSVGADEPPRVLHAGVKGSAASRWRLVDCSQPAGYAAAVAVTDRDVMVRQREIEAAVLGGP